MYYSAENFEQQLADRIQTLRKDHGWSQRDMTVMHGYPLVDWLRLEKGMGVTMTAMLRLCDVFGVTMPELVDGLGN